ncbi:DNA cytosine methyltransferase [Rhizobium leguminosarum]|uniref:DNA cytosine methyltransferase n=1 Tax=Rhizobium leguminosarum TaxID=384 RepID=UPI0021B0DA42|nr:DNA cytosine methyltransferase [Rhizobium leguminosarum]
MISVEKERAAHRTLRLRAFLRQFDEFPSEYYVWIRNGGSEPLWQDLYPQQWQIAVNEAVCRELGTPEATRVVSDAIGRINSTARGRTVLIGGPPCQAYSLVGRARNAGKKDYVPALDHRNFLYREYCRVLAQFEPSVFVMENVKGMLSSSVDGLAIFGQVIQDLEKAGPGYKLFSLSRDQASEMTPRNFVVQAEEFGVPQARHRVIIVGIRNDLAVRLPRDFSPRLKKTSNPVSVADLLKTMPPLRSGLSKHDSPSAWRDAMLTAISKLQLTKENYGGSNFAVFREALRKVSANLPASTANERKSRLQTAFPSNIPSTLRAFLTDVRLESLHGHETRGHMPSDLARYLFASCFAVAEGVSPKANKFPSSIAPEHANWSSGKFEDRFRVQRWNHPSSTVTSHISKDGHYFIHPDPAQCRSLTVREAARLQTFPDNYVFLGNRTEQYVQVGNAVPPYLALQIAEAILPVFDHI